MQPSIQTHILRFLQDDIGIPESEIHTARRLLNRLSHEYPGHNSSLFSIVLWQYGLLTLEQLEQLFDWLETTYIPESLSA